MVYWLRIQTLYTIILFNGTWHVSQIMPSMHYAADDSVTDKVRGRTLNFLNDPNGATPPYFEDFQVSMCIKDMYCEWVSIYVACVLLYTGWNMRWKWHGMFVSLLWYVFGNIVASTRNAWFCVCGRIRTHWTELTVVKTITFTSTQHFEIEKYGLIRRNMVVDVLWEVGAGVLLL